MVAAPELASLQLHLAETEAKIGRDGENANEKEPAWKKREFDKPFGASLGDCHGPGFSESLKFNEVLTQTLLCLF
jgi:hypothetical protein